MATRDYVGSRPRRRAGGRNTKKAAPRRFPVIPALLAGALLAGFGGFSTPSVARVMMPPTIEEQVKANKPKTQNNGLPQESGAISNGWRTSRSISPSRRPSRACCRHRRRKP